MVFYDGVAHKLDKVQFCIPKDKNGKDDYMSPWKFTSNDGRFEMKFKPILDRYANSDIVVISSKQHQVFGEFSGEIILDTGDKLELKNFLAFAEKVINKW